MSDSAHVEIEAAEEAVPLQVVPASGEGLNNGACNEEIRGSGRRVLSCCSRENHRALAIWSILCGLTCIGMKSLINSVKAEKTSDPNDKAKFLQKAKKYGIISIVTWVSILALIPLLMALISYLLTLQD